MYFFQKPMKLGGLASHVTNPSGILRSTFGYAMQAPVELLHPRSRAFIGPMACGGILATTIGHRTLLANPCFRINSVGIVD